MLKLFIFLCRRMSPHPFNMVRDRVAGGCLVWWHLVVCFEHVFWMWHIPILYLYDCAFGVPLFPHLVAILWKGDEPGRGASLEGVSHQSPALRFSSYPPHTLPVLDLIFFLLKGDRLPSSHSHQQIFLAFDRNLDIIWKEGILIEKLPPWHCCRQSKTVGHLLDSWLTWRAQLLVAGAALG